MSLSPIMSVSAGSITRQDIKVKMEKDILRLIRDMDKSLSFVEDIDILKDKLKRFTETIQNVLSIIHDCAVVIRDYLDSDTIGMAFCLRCNVLICVLNFGIRSYLESVRGCGAD